MKPRCSLKVSACTQEGMLKAANEILQEKVFSNCQLTLLVQTSGFIPIHHDKQLSDFCQFTLSYELHSGLVPRHDKATDAMNLMQIVEQSSLLDVGMVVADQQNGRFSTVPLVEEVISSNPLTILSGYSSCRGSEMGYSFC